MFIAHASSVAFLSSVGAASPTCRSYGAWQRNKSTDDYKHVAPRGAESRKFELLNTLLENRSPKTQKAVLSDDQKCCFYRQKMAEPTGLEPATSDVTGRRSNQLNYDSAG